MSQVLNSVLITGANGFFGKTIFKELSRNYKLFSLSRSCGDYIVSVENEIPTLNQKFDLVIHAAGKAHSIPKSEVEKKQFFDVNVLGTLNLLKGLEMVGLPEKFVFISSVSVYGQEFGCNINENHPLQAEDAYGRSKIEAEILVLEWCKRYNVICTILRLPLLVGEKPPGNLGAMMKAIDKGFYFNIGGGKARKSMVLAQDVARFIPVVSKVGGVFNLTDGYHPSFRDLSENLALDHKKILNIPFFIAKAFSYVGDIIGDKFPLNSNRLHKITSDLTFDDSKARLELKWEPQNVLVYLKNNKI